MPLTELEIKNLKPRAKGDRYMVHDAHGLYLAVMKTGEKYWYIRTYGPQGERKISLGRWPDISLKAARELRYTMKHEQDKPLLLASLIEEWFDHYSKTVSFSTAQKTRFYLNRYILPNFGGRDITSITPQDVFSIVQRLQEKSVENGQKVKTILSQFYRYAIARGLTKWNPAQQITGAILTVRTRQHFSVVHTEPQAREVLRAVSAYQGNPAIRLYLLLLAHTFVRPSELRLAQWPEMDFDRMEWRVPAERMKMRREHIVPLTRQSSALFQELRALTRHPQWCFILPFSPAPFTSQIVTRALRLMGYGRGKMTPHGFRGMASTLLNEHGFPPDVIERQLAHVEGNTVRAAYNRAEYLDERRKMMVWWSDYLDTLMK